MATTSTTFNLKSFVNGLWSGTYIIHTIILCFLALLTMEIFKFPIAGIIFFALGFSVFDVIGFNLASAVQNDVNNIAKYRITQVMVQVFMLLLVFNSTGIMTVLGCMILWWLTTCDKLFYIIQKTPQQSTDTYPWLENWSIFYILKNIFKISATATSFNALAILGVIFGIVIVLL